MIGEHEIRKLNDEYIRAAIAGDVEWYREHLADDFVCIDSDGSKLDKPAFLAMTAREPELAEYVLDEVAIEMYDRLALVRCKGLWKGKDGTPGVSRYVDLYARVGDEWKAVSAQITRPSAAPAMPHQVSGEFDVTMAPEPLSAVAEGSALGRMTLDKRFHGALDATSKGEMIAALSSVKGSAGYVAMEQVTGTLEGRQGTFVLQHSGTMNRGTQLLVLGVVPDSGTGALAGLRGIMAIRIADKKHYYDFSYDVP